MFSTLDKKFMSIALDLAKESFDFEEVPVGAVVVKDKKILEKAVTGLLQIMTSVLTLKLMP